MAVLVIADHDNASLKDTTNKTVTAAKALAGDVDILVAGQGVDAVAAHAAKIDGVRKVLVAESPELGKQIAEAVTATVLGLADAYDAILIPATAAGKNYAPRIAAKLDVAQISEIIEVVSPDTFVRPIYAGNALETVQSSDAKKLITVRPTAFKAAGEGGSATIEKVSVGEGAPKTHFVSDEIVKSDRPELAGAKIVVSGGRAMGSAEEFQRVIDPLADKLGAAVGASRAAVDAGYAPNDYQVGQTGKVVAPQLYIAIGISGAIQHLAGMKDSKVIVAINKDPDAPIFQVADYGLVSDYKTAVPDLMAALGQANFGLANPRALGRGDAKSRAPAHETMGRHLRAPPGSNVRKSRHRAAVRPTASAGRHDRRRRPAHAYRLRRRPINQAHRGVRIRRLRLLRRLGRGADAPDRRGAALLRL